MRFEAKAMRISTVLLAGVLLARAAAAADAPKSAVNCRGCHSTGTPTKEKPALLKCPRAKVQGFHSVEEAVKSITFQGKDEYGPVKFAHKAHAEMAEMGESCGSCHHYNQARSIQECRECHSPERLRDGADLGKPDLRGARHRLCLSCHRAWDADTKCGSCHEMKGAKPAPGRKALTPERVIFTLSARKKVIFPHQAHGAMYGLKCVDCHKGSSCGDCHGPGKAASAGALTIAARAGLSHKDSHRACSSCHDKAECSKCHADGAPPKRR
jgi:hypothetical protein